MRGRMRAALGLLSLEEGLTALTAGTAATATAALSPRGLGLDFLKNAKLGY